MKKSIFRTLVAALLVLVLSVSAVAWFMESEQISPEVQGSAMTGYFHAGDGTIDHPYELENPKHVYNLAWLQYMGYLNEIDPDTGKIKQTYFKLNRDIDMDGIILPPIGTTEFPFVGHFDGQGNCIRNLTVSNYLFGENDSFKIVQRPLSVTEIDGEQVSIIGFFGVVGALDDDLAALLADDSKVEEITDKVNAIHDLFLENLTVRTETSSSLIGLVAGYANGSIVNVGVAGNSDIQLGSTTQPLQPEEVADITYEVSFYSLIGQYNATNIVWKDKPTGGLVDGDENAPGAGWGSSINMLEFRKRVAYITTASGLTGTGQNYHVNGYDYHGFFSGSSAYYVTYTSRANSASFLDGTIMPLSIDQEIFADGKESQSGGYPVMLEYYQNNKATNKEPVLLTNSGYLVGGGEQTSKTDDTPHVRFIPEWVLGYNEYTSIEGGVYKSFATQYTHRGAFPENNSNFVMHMLTVGTDGKTYVITDIYNNNKTGTYFTANSSRYNFASYDSDILDFKKYIDIDETTGVDSGVRSSFVNKNSGESFLQGISFKNVINANVNNIEKITAGSVTLLGEVKQNYEMIKGAINFSLKEAGITTSILGTYKNGLGYTSLFTILELKRGSDNKIADVKIINRVYERSNPQSGQKRYVYQYSDGSFSEGSSAEGLIPKYDRESMTSLSEENALYYFEIPLNAGDYALGSTTADSKTAFLLYLDIGANGDKALGEEGDSSTGTETAYHQIEGVTFVDSLGVAAKSTSGYSVVTFKVAISEGGYGKSHGGLTVSFNRSSKTAMTVTETDSANAFGVTDVEDDDNLTVTVGPPSSS